MKAGNLRVASIPPSLSPFFPARHERCESEWVCRTQGFPLSEPRRRCDLVMRGFLINRCYMATRCFIVFLFNVFFSYPDVQSLIPDALSHLSLPLVRFFPLCLAGCLSFTSVFFSLLSLFFRCWKWSICALNRPLLPPLSLAPSHQHCCWASGVLEICQCGTRCRISLPACCDVPCPAIGSTDKE